MNISRKKISWQARLVPGGLILLSLVPVIAGAARLTQLASGAEINAENARFFATPLPVVVHIISATLYALLGAFQFTASLRRWRPRWHRWLGRWILVPAGLAAAASGLWMARFYPWPAGDGVLLYWLRLFFGAAMLAFIIRGALAARRRDFAQHGAWMIRAYAIGLGAGTQVLTHIPWFLLGNGGAPDELSRAAMMGAGWVINWVVAEWVIWKRPSSHPRSIPNHLAKQVN
ncbi:MAG: DUF2306 domain-containing protein [Anaerolineaceae bacterium]|nr:DUF2306 domain-containing protein [Anaerolineaceae bacterium]